MSLLFPEARIIYDVVFYRHQYSYIEKVYYVVLKQIEIWDLENKVAETGLNVPGGKEINNILGHSI